jgi:hypothetical protein
MESKVFHWRGFIDSQDAKAKETGQAFRTELFPLTFNMLMTRAGGYITGTCAESETFVRNFWRIEPQAGHGNGGKAPQ